jgi:FixJ family two-component response regulator
MEISRASTVICVVDDDAVVRESLKLLIEMQGVKVLDYGNCQDYLADEQALDCACLVLDVRLPGISGLQLQERLRERPDVPPIIFISGHADVPTAVQAMRAGALDFLQKPFPEQILLDRIEQAIELSAEKRRNQLRRATLSARMGLLTARERDVLDCMLAGRSNKLIADELAISVKTVEQHRAKVMEKMRANSVAELVQAVEWLRR